MPISLRSLMLAACILATIPSAAVLGQDPAGPGIITLSDGTRIEFYTLGTLKGGDIEPRNYTLNGEYKGKSLSVELRDLTKLTFKEDISIVTNKSGETFKISSPSIHFINDPRDNIYFITKNPIDNSIEQDKVSIPLHESFSIEFKSGSTLMVNPNSGEYYPTEYNYDPITGEELVESK